MKIIKENLIIEELLSLLIGNTIEFYEDVNIRLDISGKNLNLSEEKSELLREILLMENKELHQTIDILERYNNEEYWKEDLFETLSKNLKP